MRRILCAWLPAFPVNRLAASRQRHSPSAPPAEPHPFALQPFAPQPFALIETQRGARLLACLNETAEAAGLHPGQRLADARAICPTLLTEDANPAADAAALSRLATWCLRYTPMAAPDAPDGLILDITGCAHLFAPAGHDGEEHLAAHLATRLAKFGLPSRIAITGSATAAWALARWEATTATPLILPPGQEMRALALLPTACLRLDERTISSLRRVGLKTVGEMARIPRGELTARFGPAPLRKLDQAIGHIPEAIDWPHEAAPWEERLSFLEPIGTPDDLARALTILTHRICLRLEAAQSGGRAFIAHFYRVDGATPHLAITTAAPIRAPEFIAKLLREKLDTLDPGFGIDAITLATSEPEPITTTQEELVPNLVHNETSQSSPTALPELVDTLANRIGPTRLWRLAPRQSHVPERALQPSPPMPPSRTAKPRPLVQWQPHPAQPRPIRLLRRPERIQVTAPLPDEPPILFRWRRTIHRIRAATGPERIAAEWWHAKHVMTPPMDSETPAEISADSAPPESPRPESDKLRDYYEIEDTAGTRYWVFRTSLRTPAWYLHGIFG